MPLGDLAGSSARVLKLCVSTTTTLWSSRALIHTASPRGVNSMCSTALPGLRLCTIWRVCVSITCTVS